MWLELELSSHGPTLQVIGRGCRGERPPAHQLEDPGILDSIHTFSSKLGRAVAASRHLDPAALTLSQTLYASMLSGDVRDVLSRLVEASKDHSPVLVRLFIHDMELQSIPWEALCKPGTSEGFWSTDARMVVARGVLSSEAWEPGQIEGAVRVLVIAPGESDTAIVPLRNALDVGIQSGDIEWLTPIIGPAINAKELYARLRSGPVPHIVHFIGHGSIDPNGKPVLGLAADEDGESTWITAESLARELGAHFASDLRLVILEACEGAKSGVFGNAAQTFAQAGAAAVVAHLWPVKAETASTCSAVLYRALTSDAQTRGDVGAAIAAMRRTLLATSAEAFSPILYLRGESSVIFEFAKQHLSMAPNDAEVENEVPAAPPPEPFWGREKELERLHAFLADTLEGKPRAVFVTGESGIGKTALIDAFCRQVVDNRSPVVFVGARCIPQTGHEDPYGSIVDILLHLIGVVRNLSLPTDRKLLVQLQQTALQALLEVGSDLIGPLVPRSVLLPRLASLAAHGIAWAAEAHARMMKTDDSSRTLTTNQVYWQISEIFTKVAASFPFVAVIEDLHWLDEASAGLWLHLAAQLQHARHMFLGTYRTTMVAGVSNEKSPLAVILREAMRQSGDVVVNLDLVSSDERKQWSNKLLDAEPSQFDPQFRELFFERTGGYPLFALELLQTLRARLETTNSTNPISMDAIDWGQLPLRVEGVIGDKLAALDPTERDLVGMASVEGSEFTVQVLSELRREEERTLLRVISQGVEKKHKLVAPTGALRIGSRRTLRYRFHQGLVQQYVYDGLAESERMLLHGDIAECLEKLHAGQTETIALVLAHHYTRAEYPEKAIEYLVQAGERAIRLSAYHEALRHMEKALRLIARMEPGEETMRRELSVLVRLGVAHQATSVGRGEACAAAYERAHELCKALGDRESLPSVLLGLCHVRFYRGDLPALEALGQECLEVSTALGIQRMQVAAHTQFALSAYLSGRFDDALKHLGQVAQLYDPAQEEWFDTNCLLNPMVFVKQFTSWFQALTGNIDEALTGAQKMVQEAEQRNYGPTLAHAVYGLSVIALSVERPDLCAPNAERLIAVATKYNLPMYLCVGKLLRLYRSGRTDSVADYMAEIEATYRSNLTGDLDKTTYIWYCILRQDAYFLAGNDLGIVAIADEMLAWISESNAAMMVLPFSMYKGEALLRLGRHAEAKPILLQAMALAQHQGMTLFEERIAKALAAIP